MRLYHFTAATESHLGSIMREQSIRTTESNLSFAKADAGPRVVWLTRDGEPDHDLGLGRSAVNKRGARLTIEVPPGTALSWEGWARRRGSSPKDMRALMAAAGGTGHRDWYVTERPILLSEIVEVRANGETWAGADLAALRDSAPRGSASQHNHFVPWPPAGTP